MKNRVYLALKETKIPFNLQLFADPADPPADPSKDPTPPTDPKDPKPITFDDFLKDGENQAEFKRRVKEAVDNAVSTAQQNWQILADDRLSEAEKLAKMTKEEKAEYQRTKERKEFEAEKAAFEKEKLLVAVKEDLQKQSLPIAFAESLVEIGDAEKIKDAVTGIKESWDAEIQEAIKAKARQDTPYEGGAAHRTEQITSVSKLAREARIIK